MHTHVHTHTRTHAHTHPSALVPAMSGAGQPFPARKPPFSQKGVLQEGALCKLVHKYPFSIMTGAYLQNGINSQCFLKNHESPSRKDLGREPPVSLAAPRTTVFPLLLRPGGASAGIPLSGRGSASSSCMWRALSSRQQHHQTAKSITRHQC